MRIRHKIQKLVDGRSLASARKHTLRVLRSNRFPLQTKRVIETIDPAGFEQIRQRYAVADPGADWPKYLDLDRWIGVNIRRIRQLELDVARPRQILDLGCGDGTTAVPLARLGAEVVGIDIARNLVEAGNQRAAAAGLTNLKFQLGDASNLHGVADHSFDLVLSVFGAMFAPRPFDVAREMVRVTKPGGRIIMCNWIPGDPTFVSQVMKISSSFMPPPPEGFVSPMTWGVESNVIERFGGAGVPPEKIEFARDTWVFNYSGTPSQFVGEFRDYYGPTMNAFDAASKNGKVDELFRELDALFQSKNTSKSTATSIPATYLRVTVHR